MRAYLRNYGCSFSKKACEIAVSTMRRKNKATGKEEPVEYIDKDKAEAMLKKHNIMLENNVGYNFVYVINMLMADKWGSSIEDELHLCKAVKDVIDDVDACPNSIFNCWVTKTEDKGIPIPWADMI